MMNKIIINILDVMKFCNDVFGSVAFSVGFWSKNIYPSSNESNYRFLNNFVLSVSLLSFRNLNWIYDLLDQYLLSYLFSQSFCFHISFSIFWKIPKHTFLLSDFSMWHLETIWGYTLKRLVSNFWFSVWVLLFLLLVSCHEMEFLYQEDGLWGKKGRRETRGD